MRTLAKIAAALGVVGAVAVGDALPASADWYGHHHRYYNSYRGGGFHTRNGCLPNWTIQGGVCKPYHYGPWDIYEDGRAITGINNAKAASVAFSFWRELNTAFRTDRLSS
jgi:hypothetical protein